uniref:Uncharacterized protein n=1 Tax=Monodelphis domestica TaxID=13616 RepID=A0A5F8GFX8_MONDO
MFGQCMKNMHVAKRLVTVQKRQNLIIPEQRSLNLFTKNPPRNVPPPPAGIPWKLEQPPGSDAERKEKNQENVHRD